MSTEEHERVVVEHNTNPAEQLNEDAVVQHNIDAEDVHEDAAHQEYEEPHYHQNGEATAEEQVIYPQDEGEQDQAVGVHGTHKDGEYREDTDFNGEIADKRMVIEEVRRITESAMTIIRGLSSMVSCDDEELRANIVDVFTDIQAEEDGLFSPMPDYIAEILDSEHEQHVNRNRGIQPHPEVARGGSVASIGNYAEERRAFVDPSIPLMMPYSSLRERKENPNRNTSSGTYHDLFYGDGSQYTFAPPGDNKRMQLEQEQKANRIERRPPVSYEPPPRESMRVDRDFVPSCATGTSPSQRDVDNPSMYRSSGRPLQSKSKRISKRGLTSHKITAS